MIEEKEEEEYFIEKKRNSLNGNYLNNFVLRDKNEGNLVYFGLIDVEKLFQSSRAVRFRSTENLAKVVELKEENISPNPKNKRRYKLSTKLHFADRFEDNISGKRWLNEVYSQNNYRMGRNNLHRSGSCYVKPIEEVIFFKLNFLIKYRKFLLKKKKKIIDHCI